MKKLLSIIALVAALCAFGGMAEGTPLPSPLPASPKFGVDSTQPPQTFSEADAPYDGVWQPFEDGFKLYLPREWASLALDEAQAEAGLFYRAGSNDGSMGVVVGYMLAGALETIDALAGDFEQSGYTSVAQGDLNGIPAIAFERPRDGYRGVAFFHPVYPEYVLYVFASPLELPDGETNQIGIALLASITPLEVSSERLKNY